MSNYNFDRIPDRKNTNSYKWDYLEQKFGRADLLPLWVADMDFLSPPGVIAALGEKVDHGIFGYSVPSPSLKDVFVDWVEKRHGVEIKKEWCVFVPGVMPAVNMLLQTFAKKQDEIILQPPVYPPFYKAVEKQDCVVVENPLQLKKGKYQMDYQDLEKKITAKSKIFMLCSPHNPVTRVWTELELSRLLKIIEKHNLLLISDEIWSDFIYKGSKHYPIFSLVGEKGLKSITLFAPSKTFNLAGIPSAMAVIPESGLRREFLQFQHKLGMDQRNIFSEVAMEAAYQSGESWLEELLKYLQKNLALLIDFTHTRLPGVQIIKPEGTYIVWMDWRKTGLKQQEINNLLVNKAGVALNDGVSFGSQGNGFMRINIACPRSMLDEGLQRIEMALKK